MAFVVEGDHAVLRLAVPDRALPADFDVASFDDRGFARRANKLGLVPTVNVPR